MKKIKFQIFTIEERENHFELLAMFSGCTLGKLPKELIIELNKVIKELKENNFGVYYSGDVDWDGEKSNSDWVKYTFKCLNKQLLDFIKCNKIEFINKQELETIMAKNKAPYAMWAITALKNECKKRKFKVEDYEKVMDKIILVEMLKQDDVSEKSESTKKNVETENVETENVDEEIEDDFDLDEEDEKPKVEQPKIENVEDEKPKVEQPKKSGNLIHINQRLKESGYWVKGAQFLSNADKQVLIDSKNQKERDVIYKALEKKVAGISVTLSEKMKLVAKEKGSVGGKNINTEKIETEKPEPKEEAEKVISKYEGKDLFELRKIAVGRKVEMVELGITPKKSDTVEQLIEKLQQADSSKG